MCNDTLQSLTNQNNTGSKWCMQKREWHKRRRVKKKIHRIKCCVRAHCNYYIQCSMFILRVDLSRSRLFNLIFFYCHWSRRSIHTWISCTLHALKRILVFPIFFLPLSLEFFVLSHFYFVNWQNTKPKKFFFESLCVFVYMQIRKLIFYHWSNTSMTKCT